MDIAYIGILIFLFVLAATDLSVGVSNDAVNFLSSAVGSKAAPLKRIMFIACIGILLGATFSNGMMEIARHGIFHPEYFYFEEVMCIFLAVVVSDVFLLDLFNSLGLPTSTTVSMVFELLGASCSLSMVKLLTGNCQADNLGDLINTDKAFTVIVSIFLSVAIAFFFGLLVQWIARLVFTYSYNKGSRIRMSLFAGVAATSILYFMLIKGMRSASFMTEEITSFIDNNVWDIVAGCFVAFTVLMYLLQFVKVNVLKIVVLMGTFALAMAFAGNDLVNFIGVTLAGLSSFMDFSANAAGMSADSFLMNSLNDNPKTPIYFLTGAGVIMVIALTTSKKARKVLQTSIDLSRQDEGDEMFGTSSLARSLVRSVTQFVGSIISVIPLGVKKWINSRFDTSKLDVEEGAAFDLVRASVNLVLAGLLIAIGTSLKLPLSTTYVAFMVAMGTSLADRAWGRESAVFRVTGVVSVIGGWFVTAGAAFIIASLVVLVMHFGGMIGMYVMIGLTAFNLYRSHKAYNKKQEKAQADAVLNEMMNSNDPNEVYHLLLQHTSETLSHTLSFVGSTYGTMFEAFAEEDLKALRHSQISIVEEKGWMKKMRRKETMGIQRLDEETAFRMNTWFHLSSTNCQQLLNTLNRICDPMREHTDNNFKPLPQEYVEEFTPFSQRMKELFKAVSVMVNEGDFTNAHNVSERAKYFKKELSDLRKLQTERLRDAKQNLKVALVYLNLIQESHELVSEVRNVLRGSEKFIRVDPSEIATDVQKIDEEKYLKETQHKNVAPEVL